MDQVRQENRMSSRNPLGTHPVGTGRMGAGGRRLSRLPQRQGLLPAGPAGYGSRRRVAGWQSRPGIVRTRVWPRWVEPRYHEAYWSDKIRRSPVCDRGFRSVQWTMGPPYRVWPCGGSPLIRTNRSTRAEAEMRKRLATAGSVRPRGSTGMPRKHPVRGTRGKWVKDAHRSRLDRCCGVCMRGRMRAARTRRWIQKNRPAARRAAGLRWKSAGRCCQNRPRSPAPRRTPGSR